MKTGYSLALGGLMLAGSAFAEDLPAGDPARGETLIGQCRTCHGSDGIAKLIVAPNIGGESEAYLGAQLLAYKTGARQNEMMTIIAQNLAEQDIADMAAWYASQNITATLDADPSDAPELCVACHGADGLAQVEDVPNLAGETAVYLEAQLEAFRSGERVNEVMSPVAADLTDEDIKEMADWYAAITLTADATGN